MGKVAIALAFGALLLPASGCNDRDRPPKPKVSAQDAASEPDRAADASVQVIDEDRDRFVAQADRDMQQLRRDLDRLGEQAKSASGEMRARLERRIAELEPWRAQAEARLAELKARGSDAARDAEARFSEALDALKRSYRAAKEEFQRS
jgi:hypothetical protein